MPAPLIIGLMVASTGTLLLLFAPLLEKLDGKPADTWEASWETPDAPAQYFDVRAPDSDSNTATG